MLEPQTHAAILHPHWAGGRNGYVYDVAFRGELIVSRARDPEHAAARALLSRGITGTLELIDANTGRTRTRFDIEVAAGFTVAEGDERGLCRQTWRPFAAVEARTPVSLSVDVGCREVNPSSARPR